VGVANLGGFSAAAIDYATHELARIGAHVCVFSETQLAGTVALANIRAQLSQAAGSAVRMWAVNGPLVLGDDGLPTTKRQHGVAIAVADGSVRVREVAHHPHGMLALALRRRGMTEVLVVAVYLPPKTSFARARRETVTKAVAELLASKGASFGDVFVVGDLNLRLGALDGRATEDTTTRDAGPLVSKLLRPYGLSPLHGRAPDNPALSTSRQVGRAAGQLTGRAEVDYVLARSNTTATPLPAGAWHDGTGVSHRIIGFAATLVGSGTPEANALHRKPAQRPCRPPPYSDSLWGERFPAVNAGVDSLLAAAPIATLELRYSALVRLFQLPVIKEEASAPTRETRTYRGVSLSGRAITALAERRLLIKRRNASRDATERIALAARIKDLAARANALCKIAVARARQRHVEDLEWARRRDPHRLAGVMRRAREGYFSGEPGLPADCAERYTEHYRNLCTAEDKAPPAVADDAWREYSPTLGASKPATWVPYSELDVYLAVFGLDAHSTADLRNNGGHAAGCTAACTQCAAAMAQADAHAADGKVPPPTWSPTLKTSRSAGPDNVTAEAIKWFRDPNDAEGTTAYRVKLSRLLAGFLNDVVDDGAPTGLLDVNVTAVPKANFVPDIPDTTRPVSVHNTLSKIAEIIDDTRLLHALVTDGVITERQAGFMPHRSCDGHVFTVKEVVKARWRAGLDTWMGFIDARKAYDSVSPTAMWALLERLGAPARLLAHIKRSYAARRQFFTYNGAVQATWTQRNGLSTGAILSPILFNIFIDTLWRFIEADATFTGVTLASRAESVTVKGGMYADDVHLIAKDRAELERAMARVQAWAKAHGIVLNVGVTKTTAMHFALAPGDDVPAPLDIGDGISVPFAREYKFLGHRLTTTLDVDGERDDALGPMNAAFGSFMGDDIMHSCSVRFQAGMFSASVLGAASHLLSTTAPSRELVASVDKLITTAAAYVFRTSKQRGIAQTGAADLGVLTGIALVAREQHRLFLTLRRADCDARTAAAVFRIVHDTDAGIVARRGHSTQRAFPPAHRSWFVGYYDLVVRTGGRRVKLLAAPDAGPLWGVSGLAADRARHAAHAQWRAKQLRYLRTTGGAAVRDATTPVTSVKPLRHILERYNFLPMPLPQTGGGLVQLSTYGPGATSVLGSSSAAIRFAVAVHRARQGRAGLFVPPVWRAPRGAPALKPDAFRLVYRSVGCDLCGAACGDAVHFATACRHPAMAARRASVLSGDKFSAAVGRLADALAKGLDGAAPPQTLTDALAALTPESAEGRFIIGSLLTAVAWSHASVPAEWAAAGRLGRYFDRAVPAASVAAACTVWVEIAGRILRKLCRDWCFLIGPRRLRALVNAGFRLPPPARVRRLDRNARQ
jgi:hypothetical protein